MPKFVGLNLAETLTVAGTFKMSLNLSLESHLGSWKCWEPAGTLQQSSHITCTVVQGTMRMKFELFYLDIDRLTSLNKSILSLSIGNCMLQNQSRFQRGKRFYLLEERHGQTAIRETVGCNIYI